MIQKNIESVPLLVCRLVGLSVCQWAGNLHVSAHIGALVLMIYVLMIYDAAAWWITLTNPRINCGLNHFGHVFLCMCKRYFFLDEKHPYNRPHPFLISSQTS